MDTTQLVRQAAPIGLPPLARGYILTAPSSFSESVKVVIPEGSTERTYGPCKWSKVNGTAKPAAGAACVIAFDNEHFPTVVWWEGTTPTSGNEVAGVVRAFVGITLPEGWLLCDGTEYKVATYKLLFEALGSKEGKAGEFAVPDLRGKFPLGVSGSHALLTTGGEEKVKLTEGQMPKHLHKLGISGAISVTGGTYHVVNLDFGTEVNTSETGGGESHENMPPFLATKWIIATGIGGGTPGAEGKAGKEGPEGKAGAEGKEGKAGAEGKEGPAGSPKTAKAPLKVVGTEIELETGQLTNAYIKAAAGIEESKLSLPEVIVKTGSQTVTGLKTFESVTGPEEAKPITGAEAIKLVIASGNVNTTVSAAPPAGAGGALKVTAGIGGTAPNATTTSTGGKGGNVSLTAGAGGLGGTATGAVKAVGGEGGEFKAETGAGGWAEGDGATNTGTLKAGLGGQFRFASGPGGKVVGSTGVMTAGAGGPVKFITGAGGEANGATGTAGTGGALLFETGKGGGASNGAAEGKGGPVQFVLGQASTAAAEANSGSLQVFFKNTEAANLRFEITPEGLTKVKKGLTVEGALTLPAESVAQAALKVAVPGETKAETANAEHEVLNESTMVYLSIVCKAEATAFEVLVDGKPVYTFPEETLATSSKNVLCSAKVKAKGKWEVKVTKGTLTEIKAVLQAG